MNAYAGAIEALQLYNSLLEQAGKISPGSRDYADIERGLSISYQTASLTIAFAVLEEIRLVAVRLDSSDAKWQSAVQTARSENPYTLDVFTPVSDDDWARLHDLVQQHLGHGLDRYSAAMMRRAWDACTTMIESMATTEAA